jgi:PST family polysaccharide transporter
MVQVLAVAGWFAPFGITSYWSFILHDQSRQLLYQNLITKPFTVVLIVLSVPYGPLAVAGAYALSLAVSWPVNLVWLARTAHQDSSKFLGHGLIMLFAAGAAFSAVGAAFHYLDQLGPFAAISLSAGGASVIFFSIAMAFPQARSQLRDGIWLARSALRSRARG